MSSPAKTGDAGLAALAQVAGDRPTPFLVIERERLLGNIGRMQAWFDARPSALRPHVKSHKCTAIARLQVEAGACGVTCSTTDEVAAMVAAGIDDVLLANVVIDRTRLASLAASAARATVTAAVDSLEAVARLDAAAEQADVRVGAVIDCDVGMGRNGVRSVEEAVAVADALRRSRRLTLRGAMGFEGHLVDLPDRAERAERAVAALSGAVAIRDELARIGYEVPVFTGGSSATYDASGAMDAMTELQAGSYALMDADYRRLVTEFTPALGIVATVTTSASDGAVVVDVGSKRLAVDCGTPELLGYPAEHRYTAEEHTVYTLLDGPAPQVGERVVVLPAHGCSTMSMYRDVLVCADAAVTETWAIDARDPLA